MACGTRFGESGDRAVSSRAFSYLSELHAGFACDLLKYEKTPDNLATGGHQIVFTIAVDPEYRGNSIGSKLLDALEKNARISKRKSISLTSLERNVPFYLKNGFENKGVVDSEHADEVWYNLVKK